jgi:uncharacterized membrane protein
MSEAGPETPSVAAPGRVASAVADDGGLVTPSRASIQVIYVLLLAGILTGGVAAIVGVALAYLGRSGAPDWLDTHYEYAIRTFWFGAVYCLLSGTVFSLAAAIGFGVSLVDGLIGGFVLVLVLAAGIAFLALLWWIIRCAQGLDHVSRDQAIPNPKSWLFAH